VRPLALALLLAAPAAAVRPLTPPAPEFPDSGAWLNSKPLPMSLLRGRKAVVVAFLNPVGLDSIRELAALKAWFDRYALSGLLVVGVVTPSAEFERNVLWLQAELKRERVEFPVIVDADRKLWNDYQNQGWPALYLVDRNGRIVFDQLGEGGFKDFENEMRSALGDVVGSSSLPPAVNPAEPRTHDCGRATPDVALGLGAKKPAHRLAERASRRDQIVPEASLGDVVVVGRWEATPDGLRLPRTNASLDSFIRINYGAAQVFGVFSPPFGRRARFYIKRDDEWLHSGDAGRDVRFDEDGRSYVPVDSPRLYDLVREDSTQGHQLFVLPDAAGSALNGVSFADSCLVTDLP
jgi:hypothetical protein